MKDLNSNSESKANGELPLAIEVKREVLKKVDVQLTDLPVAGVFPEEAAFQEEHETETNEDEKYQEDVESEEVRPEADPVQEGVFKPLEASVNRRPLDLTNKGRSPKSRFYIRGILHPNPMGLRFAALFALLARLSLAVFIVLVALVLFEKLEIRYAWFMLAFPVFGLLHLMTMTKGRCRVCGQREFMPSGAFKHKDRHRFLFFGPIISTALHLLLFKWIRCMFCGTPIRTKK